ncbi:CPBP family intramembrane glutamic endopeptidase [Psychrobacter sp. GP33]|uniref:CPBP family intramembrane glutamic endopeptidase n=1 Tax=Psychrobacter sp. GP33 TaxID=2758709 RepID=UPI0021754B70|nr:CPBP family intramembrane glutamic endopeptidase [Psychrobacter sp. GP33]
MINDAKPLSIIGAPLLASRPLFSRFGVPVLVLGMVIAFFVSQLIGIYLASSMLLPAVDTLTVDNTFFLGSADGTIVSASILISWVLLTLLIMAIIRAKGGDIRHYLALTPFSWVTAGAMIGILVIFMLGSQVLTNWMDRTPLDFVDPLYQSVDSVWLLVIAMVIVAPIYEELVFRGLLWSAISEQFSTPRGAVIASIVTSIIFAVIHLQYGLYEITTIMLLALIFCYARIKSGSVLLPILLHIINNGVAMGQYLIQVA